MVIQDLVKGVNFSILSSADGTQHEQLIELAIPKSYLGEDSGIGFVMITTDTASNIPEVPDAATTTKWQRYIWFRRPYVGSSVKTGLAYMWNDDQPSDATFLKWVLTQIDTTQLETDVNTALSNAANALTQATASNTTANTALANANTAISTANAASTNATNALTSAGDASDTADEAQADASAALTKANQALAAVESSSLITGLTPGSAGTKIRTKQDGSVLEYFLDKNNYIKISDTKADTTAADSITAAASWQKRLITTEDSDTGDNCTLSSSVITLKKGTYRVLIVAMANSCDRHQARLRQTSGSAATLLKGTVAKANSGNTNPSTISGIIILTDDTTTMEIQHRVQTNGSLGEAASFGESEVYMTAEFFRID